MRQGLLIINLGTPNQPDIKAVTTYLSEFLTDKRVIDLPAIIRYLLVYFFIIPLRAKSSAHSYQTIWTDQGSPLLKHCMNVLNQLQGALGSEIKVALGMRYGKPSIKTALDQLKECDAITILPLYPQYSSAATGSSIEKVLQIYSLKEVIPSLTIIHEFYQHPAYIKAQAHVIQPYLRENTHLLLSYHGIPERHIHKTGCKTICIETCPSITQKNHNCYKAQCHQTSELLAKELKLNANQYSTSFQSQLGKTPWIQPYTDAMLAKLATRGIRHLVISCPSFVADCLETLEEIGVRAKQQWLNLGGEHFDLVPCMNNAPEWIKAIIEISKCTMK